MENIIEVKNLTHYFNKELIFNNLELEIPKEKYTTILNINSNTTMLIKIILGFIKNDALIKVNNKEEYDRDIIGYIPNNIDDTIIMDTVIDEIMFNNDKFDEKELDKLLEEVGLNDKKYENPKNLSGGEKQLMYIVSVLLKHPKLIICDDSFRMLDNLVKDKILKHLKKISKENKISILNITNNTEDILYGDNVVIISNNQIIINEEKETLYNNEKLFKQLNINMPFMLELSLKLRYYELLKQPEIDMNRMINKLWK